MDLDDDSCRKRKKDSVKEKKEKKESHKDKKESHHKEKKSKHHKEHKRHRSDSRRTGEEESGLEPKVPLVGEDIGKDAARDRKKDTSNGRTFPKSDTGSRFHGMAASSDSEPESGEICAPINGKPDVDSETAKLLISPASLKEFSKSPEKVVLDSCWRKPDSLSPGVEARQERKLREKEKYADEELGEVIEKRPRRIRSKSRSPNRDKSANRELKEAEAKTADKVRSREREHDKERRDRERLRIAEKDKEIAREKDREKLKEREREKRREKDREKELDRERVRDKDRELDRDRARDKGRERNRDRGRDYSRRSRSPARDSGRHRDRDRARDGAVGRGDSYRSKDHREKEPSSKEEEEYMERISAAMNDDEEENENKAIEERRKKRAEILAKYKSQQKETAAIISPTATELAFQGDGKDGKDEHENADDDDEVMNDSDAAFTDQLQKSACVAEENEEGGDVVDDMFGENTPDELAKKAAGGAIAFVDNWDDADGYYRARVGETLNSRYEVTGEVGRGVFSTVLKGRDLESMKDVAIKVIRANDVMYKTAQIETAICKKLAGADPENKRHCVKFLGHFEFRDHVFMVFEPMAMNLREVLKKYGRNVGLSIHAVQKFAYQMLLSLKHIKNCGVLHADIKLDNMLVNDKHNLLKMCDFGSAMFAGQNEITPYLVSRFYRPPEVVLGLEYSFPMDLWAVGACLFELCTGKIAFPGRTNNEMLKLFMDLSGAFPKKMLKKALFSEKHFDDDYNFSLMEEDPVTKGMIRRIIANPGKAKDMATALGVNNKSLTEEEKLKVLQLADLLSKMFILDPDKRIKVQEALHHPFIRDSRRDMS